MLLKQLVLHNIRSYVHQVIDFPQGSVLLQGDIGSGKSTVLLAIAFALFGADTDHLSGQSILRSGKNDGFVQLTLNIDSQEVTIYRALKKNRGSIAQLNGFILKNGTKTEGMPIELKAAVLQMLGYPLMLASKKKNFMYSYTVYCPQEEMKFILGDDKELRLDIIRKIFGIDKYSAIRNNAGILLRELRFRHRDQQTKSQGLIVKKTAYEERRKSIEHLVLQDKQLQPRLNYLRGSYAQCRLELVAKEKEWKECIEKKRQRDVFQEQLRLQKEVAIQQEKKQGRLEAHLREHQSLMHEDVEQQLREKDGELQSLVTTQHTLVQRRFVVDKQVAELEKNIGEGRRDVAQLDIQSKHLVQQIQQKQLLQQESEFVREELEKNQLARVEFEHNEKSARAMVDRIAHLSLCPTCFQEVPTEHKTKFHAEQHSVMSVAADKQNELAAVVSQVRLKMNEVQDKLRVIAEHEEQLRKIQRDIELAALFNKHFDERRAQLTMLQEEKIQIAGAQRKFNPIDIDSLREQVIKLRNKKEQIALLKKSAQELDELRREHLHTQQKINLLTQEISVGNEELLKQLEEQRFSLQQSQDKLHHEERELSLQSVRLMAERRALEQQLSTLEEELKIMEQAAQVAEQLSGLCGWLDEFLIPLMDVMERKVMLRIHLEFNEPFQKWYGMLVADESMTARIDDSFSPVVEQNGYDIDVSYLSGGERTSAALAYRLALNKVVHDVVHSIKTRDILILDEPTDGFSSEQLDRMRDVLQQLNIAQIIIVSHEQKMESFVEHVLHVGKENGMSKIMP